MNIISYLTQNGCVITFTIYFVITLLLNLIVTYATKHFACNKRMYHSI
jgi:hypothetical protein